MCVCLRVSVSTRVYIPMCTMLPVSHATGSSNGISITKICFESTCLNAFINGTIVHCHYRAVVGFVQPEHKFAAMNKLLKL